MTFARQIGGLWCHEVADRLEPYVAGRLEPDVRARVEEHVAACEHCASFGARYGALIARVKEMARDDASTPEASEVEARLRERLRALE